MLDLRTIFFGTKMGAESSAKLGYQTISLGTTLAAESGAYLDILLTLSFSTQAVPFII